MKKRLILAFFLHPMTVVNSPATHDAVNMGMKSEVLSPGVEDSCESDLGAQILLIFTKGQQCMGCSLEEQLEHTRPMPHDERVEFVRQSKDDMVIRRGQQIRHFEIDPFFFLPGPAIGTMAIATAVILPMEVSAFRLIT